MLTLMHLVASPSLPVSRLCRRSRRFKTLLAVHIGASIITIGPTSSQNSAFAVEIVAVRSRPPWRDLDRCGWPGGNPEIGSRVPEGQGEFPKRFKHEYLMYPWGPRYISYGERGRLRNLGKDNSRCRARFPTLEPAVFPGSGLGGLDEVRPNARETQTFGERACGALETSFKMEAHQF